MYKKWINKYLLLISLLATVVPFTSPLASVENQAEANSAEQLLQQYKRQQGYIENIKSYQGNISTLEQEALNYRLFSRHLTTYEILNQLSTLLITQKETAKSNPAIMAEINTIMQQNNVALKVALDGLQAQFNEEYEQQEKYSTEALHLYIELLTLQDKVYSAMTQQIINQQALGFDVVEAKERLVNQLYNRAESFSGMVELVLKKREELSILIGLKADNQALKDTLSVVKEQLVIARSSFTLSVRLLSQLGSDVSFYQRTLLKLGGQITSDLLDISILTEILNKLLHRMIDYFVENGGEWIFTTLLLLGIYYIFRTLAKVVRKILKKSLNSRNVKLSSLMKDMIISSVSHSIMVLGLFIGLAQLNISLAPILAGLGVAGFIVGFALQDTLSNFAAGMMILIYRPYDVGDLVEVGGGVFGKVESMNLVSTTILTIDNQTLVIPNSKIWGDVIKNVTSQKLRRVDLVFCIGYSDDIEKTEAVLAELVSAHSMVLKYPEPIIKLHVLNESSVDFVVRPWVNTEDYWDVYWDLTRQVKMRFDQDGISIPFPQRDIHVYPVVPPTD